MGLRKILNKTVHLLDNLSRWSGKFLALLILLMISIVIYEVTARYLFNSPTNWALEAATMVFGTYMICGGAYTLFNKAHVAMDIFYMRWTDRTKAIVDCITYPIAAFFFGLILWKSWSYGIESVQMNEHSLSVWGPPLYHWKMTVPLGILLLMLQQLADFIRNLTLAITGEKLS